MIRDDLNDLDSIIGTINQGPVFSTIKQHKTLFEITMYSDSMYTQ